MIIPFLSQQSFRKVNYKVDENDTSYDSVSFFTVTNKNVAVSVIKKAGQGSGTVIRIFNTTESKQKTDIILGFDCNKATEVNLNEETVKDIGVNNNIVSLSLKPWQIKTLII